MCVCVEKSLDEVFSGGVVHIIMRPTTTNLEYHTDQPWKNNTLFPAPHIVTPSF
jgi:hypothetical protein